MAGNSKFERIISGVVAVIYNSKKEVLFVKQRSGPYGNFWLIPGGCIEMGEDCITAIKREVLEETGIAIENPEYMKLYEMIGEWHEGIFHLMMSGFKCKSDSLIPPNFTGHNVDGITWAKPDEIRFHSSDLMILNDAGITRYSSDEISRALKKDRLTMKSYTGSGVFPVF